MEFVTVKGRSRDWIARILAFSALGLGVCSSALASPASSLCRIFLVQGAFGGRSSGGSSTLFLKPEEYFAEYRAFFTAKGCDVKSGEFPEDGTIEERASILRSQVERWGSGAPLFIIAHSQGGLDARLALKQLGLQGVAGLFTIGTPHDGTPAANWVLEHRERKSPLYWSLKTFAAYDLETLSFAGEMTSTFLQDHREYFAAVPNVRYASARGVCRQGCHWLLRFSGWWWGIGPGDGLIPGDSQRFGEDLGEFDLDHISEIGVDADKRKVRQALFEKIWLWMFPLDNGRLNNM